MFFSRKKKVVDIEPEVVDTLPTLADDDPIWNEPGPRDAAEVDHTVGYMDMGSLKVPVVQGMQVQTQMAADGTSVLRVLLVLGTSGLQISLAAAPRSGGVWDELREQMIKGLAEQGATAEERHGRYGVELLTTSRVAGPDGAAGTVRTRIIGREGPRWFARIDVLGPAAVDEAVAAEVEKVIDRLVVLRDDKPRARLDVLPLTVPAGARERGSN